MSNVILTVDGAEKIKEEILHIETIKLPELKEDIKKHELRVRIHRNWMNNGNSTAIAFQALRICSQQPK